MSGRLSQRKGVTGEDAAHYVLKAMGLKMIEPVYVGWRLLRTHRNLKGRKLAEVVPQAKVSGDFRAITDDGRSVLIEVKLRDGKLKWSHFAEHQRRYLTQHAELGGLSLVVWVASDIHVIQWPTPLIGYRKAMTEEQAAQHDYRRRGEIFREVKQNLPELKKRMAERAG